MPVELAMLLLTTLILFALVFAQAGRNLFAMGPAWGMSNRDKTPPVDDRSARTTRAIANHKEGLLFFIPLVLAVMTMDVHNALTQAGSVVYCLSRLVHAIAYVAGLGPVRSLAWTAGIGGLLAMVLGLF